MRAQRLTHFGSPLSVSRLPQPSMLTSERPFSLCSDDNQITDELIDRLAQQASSEVNRAVAETVRHLQDRRRPRTPGDLMSLMKFPKPLQLTLAKTEDIFERALDLVHRYVDNITFSSDSARNEMRTIGNCASRCRQSGHESSVVLRV